MGDSTPVLYISLLVAAISLGVGMIHETIEFIGGAEYWSREIHLVMDRVG